MWLFCVVASEDKSNFITCQNGFKSNSSNMQRNKHLFGLKPNNFPGSKPPDSIKQSTRQSLF